MDPVDRANLDITDMLLTFFHTDGKKNFIGFAIQESNVLLDILDRPRNKAGFEVLIDFRIVHPRIVGLSNIAEAFQKIGSIHGY